SKSAFPGTVDSLVLRAYRLGEPLQLPDELVWPAGAPRRIRFDVDGTLDSDLHPEGVRLPFETAPGQVETVSVSKYGTVD
ncbi:MAG: hypothetical protein AAFZ65_10945, partial [Planctomycetota bacterium]